MADSKIFAHTAVYNADVAPFYTKWMRDVREAQSASGGFLKSRHDLLIAPMVKISSKSRLYLEKKS